MSLSIDPDRLLKDLKNLAAIGRDRTGVHRPALSPEEVDGRRWVAGRFGDAGLDVSMDRFGTTLGRAVGVDRAIVIGSHTDTVPHGGWLDGALGVIYGLEIARVLGEAGWPGGIGIDVANFQDEEGTFFSCIGSKTFFGELSADDDRLAGIRDMAGRDLAECVAAAGLPDDTVAMDPARHVAYLEAHIEQGPRLEKAGLPIGVVPSIVGIRRYEVTARGRADHAGTTPMELRQDAGAALLHLGSEVHRRFRAMGAAETVWNIGSIRFSPGAPNVVPDGGTMIVECRAQDAATLDRMEAEIQAAAGWAAREAAAPIDVSPQSAIPPAALDDRVAGEIRLAARDLQIGHLDIPSGAGHDAMVAGRHLPSAMLFVPSIGGRSHTIEEDTDEADIIAGCRVLLRACERLIADL